MSKYPGLEKREGIYRYRSRTPSDLHKLVANNKDTWFKMRPKRGSGSSEFDKIRSTKDSAKLRDVVTKSLETSNYQEAKSRYHQQASEFELLYEKLRISLSGEGEMLTKGQARQIALEYFNSQDKVNTSGFERDISQQDAEQILSNIETDLTFATQQNEQTSNEYVTAAASMLRERGNLAGLNTEAGSSSNKSCQKHLHCGRNLKHHCHLTSELQSRVTSSMHLHHCNASEP